MQPNTSTTPLSDRDDEVLLPIGGQTIRVRFGLKFLKALTDKEGANGPGDILERLQNAPLGTLLEMAEQAIRLSKQGRELPADLDLLDELDELPRAELKNLFSVLLSSVTRNPLMEVLTQGNPS